MRLVYHPVPKDSTSSGIYEAMRDVASSTSEVLFVGLYINLSQIDAIRDGREFRLVTDIEEAITHGSVREWCKEHQGAIRHVRGLHAKAVIGEGMALLGSANLTPTSLERRFEMCALTDDVGQVEELKTWFSALWHAGEEVGNSRMEAVLARQVAVPRYIAGAESLPKTGKVKKVIGSNPVVEVTSEMLESVAKVLRSESSDRRTADKMLTLFREALILIGLDISDPRLHVNYYGRTINITLGGRYVLWISDDNKEVGLLGFMLNDFELAARISASHPHSAQRAFSKNNQPYMPSFYWPRAELDTLPPEVLADWRLALQQFVNECGQSPHRSSTKPELFQILSDDQLCSQVLDLAFPPV